MIASGAPITEVQHRLGHDDPAITLRVYSHFFRHNESAVTDRLAEAILTSHGSREQGHDAGFADRLDAATA
jgi:hypothetical protein